MSRKVIGQLKSLSTVTLPYPLEQKYQPHSFRKTDRSAPKNNTTIPFQMIWNIIAFHACGWYFHPQQRDVQALGKKRVSADDGAYKHERDGSETACSLM
jgi:hypothetical protein